MQNETRFSINNTGEQSPLLLSQNTESTSRYTAFVRWMQRETLLRQWFLSPRPVNTESALISANLANNFSDGMAFSRYTVWPTVLAGALLNDIIYFYTHPQNRYNDTMTRILAGLSSRERVVSTHFGSFLAGELTYWLAPLFLIGLPLATGAIQSVRYRQHNNPPAEVNNQIINIAGIASAEFAVLWNGNITATKRLIYVNQIVDLVNGTFAASLPVKIRALQALATIIRTLKSSPIRRRYRDNADITRVLSAAKNGLNNSLLGNPFLTIYQNYLRWSVGELRATTHAEFKRYLGLQILLFWPSVLYSWYSSARFWELLALKIQNGFSYYFAQQHCTQQNRIYAYVDAIADYACAVCPDWSFVYYNNIFSAQGCLRDLLAAPRASGIILDGATRLVAQPGIEEIDLTQQNWTDWNEAEWQTLLDLFTQGQIERLQLVNLSQPQPLPPWINDRRIALLGDFIAQVPIANLDLENQPLGDEHWRQLLRGLNQTNTHHLNIGGTRIGDAGFADFAQQNPQMSIQTLQASNNQIGDSGIATFTTHLTNATTHLDLSNNPIGNEGITALMRNLGRIETLNLSGVDLSQLDMNEFGINLQHSRVTTLNLSHCRLSDDQLSDLVPYLKHVRSLNIADNEITADGVADLMMENQLDELIISNNPLGDEGMIVIAENLPHLPLQRLALENVDMQATGFTAFVQALPHSHIHYFNAADNALGDRGAWVLADVLTNETSTLQGFNLGNTQITDEGGRILLQSVAESNVTQIELPQNQLSDQTAFATAEILQEGHPLKYINFDDNAMTPAGANTIIKAAPGSALTHIYFNRNPLDDSVGITLAQHLVSPIPNQENLATSDWGHDDTRYLWKTAHPSTQFQEVGLADCHLGEGSKRALERILPLTSISWENINFEPEQTSSASSARSHSVFYQGYSSAMRFWQQPPAIPPAINTPQTTTAEAPAFANNSLFAMLLPGLQLLLLTYLLYRLFKPMLQQATKNTSEFFSMPKPEARNSKNVEEQKIQNETNNNLMNL